MTAGGCVDLLIPRGGAGLIRACVENATVPCIQTGTGICHIYVDDAADLDKARATSLTNAKASRPCVCNAEEVCLVHSAPLRQKFLPMLAQARWWPGPHGAGPASGGAAAGPSAPPPSSPARPAGPERLRHRVSGLHSGRQGGGQRGRGHCPHRRPLHRPQRMPS